MGVPYQQAAANLDQAVAEIFTDPKVRSVGIGLHENQFGYFVVRNSAMILPQGAILGKKKAKPLPAAVQNVPLVIRDTPQELHTHLKVPFAGPGSPTAA